MIDIISDGTYPANALSNFTAHAFMFRGVECASMEGLLQALKFEQIDQQIKICQMVGKEAKEMGLSGNAWQETQALWWHGAMMDRHGNVYQEFLDEAFAELYVQNADAQKALLSTGAIELTHSIGVDDPHQTVLTAQEFCQRLMEIRSSLMELLLPGG